MQVAAGQVAARGLQVHAATGAKKILQAGCMPQENKITKESVNRHTFPPFFTRLTDSPYARRFPFFFFTSDHMRPARCIGALPFFFTSPTNCARAAAAAYQVATPCPRPPHAQHAVREPAARPRATRTALSRGMNVNHRFN